MPIEELLPYREFDREEYSHKGEDYLDELTEKIKKNGITEPVQLEVYSGKGLISEGNHRLAVAKRLGIKYIPTYVYERSREFASNKGKTKELPSTGSYQKAKYFGVHVLNSSRSPMAYGFNSLLPAEIKKLSKGGKLLYHGSNKNFEQFNEDLVSTGESADLFGKGFYLTDNKDIANVYAKNRAMKEHITHYTPTGIFGTEVPHYKKGAEELSEQGKYINEFRVHGKILDAETYLIPEPFKKRILELWVKYSGFPLESGERVFDYLKNNKENIHEYRGELWYIIKQLGFADKHIVEGITEYIKAMGYDGIKYPADKSYEKENGYNYVMFNKNKIEKVLEDGGELEDSVDKTYKTAIGLFMENEYDIHEGANSKTTFGHSRYFYVNYEERSGENIGYGIKVRVSDHSVESIDRMRSEILINAFAPDLQEAIFYVDRVLKKEYFTSLEEPFTYYDEVIVGGKEYNPETDELLEELGVSKRGHQKYRIKKKKYGVHKFVLDKRTGGKRFVWEDGGEVGKSANEKLKELLFMMRMQKVIKDKLDAIKEEPVNSLEYDFTAIPNNQYQFVAALFVSMENKDKYNKTSLENLAKKFNIEDKNIVKELAELTICLLARGIAREELTEKEKFDKMVELYHNQVNLSHRTSQSMMLQQYSTPVPIGYVMGLYCGFNHSYKTIEKQTSATPDMKYAYKNSDKVVFYKSADNLVTAKIIAPSTNTDGVQVWLTDKGMISEHNMLPEIISAKKESIGQGYKAFKGLSSGGSEYVVRFADGRKYSTSRGDRKDAIEEAIRHRLGIKDYPESKIIDRSEPYTEIIKQQFFEPSAGNGNLLVAGDPKDFIVNEIDDQRNADLRFQGFKEVLSQDASHPFHMFEKKFDGVVTNPPFGSIDAIDYDGYKISSLEQHMALIALETMKDDGKCAIIIGGHTEWDELGRIQAGKNRIFFSLLYRLYNVEDVINIDGHSLYSRQGTAFDTRIILINGRKKEPSGFPPLLNKRLEATDNHSGKTVMTFEQLWDRVSSVTLK